MLRGTILCAAALLCASIFPLHAQGYLSEINYGTAGLDGVNKLLRTSDGGFLLLGSTEGILGGPRAVSSGFVIKAERNGSGEWQRGLSTATRTDLLAAHEMPDGGYLVIGHHPQRQANPAYMARLNRYGFIVWERSFGSDSDTANDGLVEVYAAARTSLPTMMDLR